MTATELYKRSIRSLPAAQRLELAKLILEDIPSQSVVDYSEQWSDEDIEDLRRSVISRWDAEEGSSGAETR